MWKPGKLIFKNATQKVSIQNAIEQTLPISHQKQLLKSKGEFTIVVDM